MNFNRNLESLRVYTWNQNLIWLLQVIRAYPGQSDRWRFWRDGFGHELEVVDRNEFKIKRYTDKDYHWDLWYFSPPKELLPHTSLLLIEELGAENFRLFFYGLDGYLRHFSWENGKINKPSIFSYPIETLFKIAEAIRTKESNQFLIVSDTELIKERYPNLYVSIIR